MVSPLDPYPGSPRARPARGDWSVCPFPRESDAAKIDDAVVLLQVTVSASGAVEAVEVLDEPGHGFGREAQACAAKQTYVPAVDAQGQPARGTTKPFRVHFVR